jgi:hypothetical protein
MLSSPPSSGPLVLQSRSHYLTRSSPHASRRDDVLKDVHQLTNIDLDVWTALTIQGVVLDLAVLEMLSLSEQRDWLKAVQSIGITVFGLDRRHRQAKNSGVDQPNLVHGFEFPVIRLNDRLLLTTLRDTAICLSHNNRPDRVVFLGRSWGDRVVSWLLGCRFTAVSAPTQPAYQKALL